MHKGTTEMRTARTVILNSLLAALAALALAACGREQAVSGAANPLLGYVPADTPYVAANLEPLPEAIADAYLQRVQPVLDEMQAQLERARADLENEVSGEAGDDSGERLALAILGELDGKLSREGLDSLGIDVLAHRVLYGVGAFPVLRSGLADAATLRATVQRVLDKAGINAPERELQGVSYWRVAPADAGTQAPVGLYIAILADHLAVGVLPTEAEPALLPAFLGLEQPQPGSDAGAELAALNRAHGYTPHGSAIVDLRRLADEFLLPDRLTAGVMAATGAYDPADITPECVSEVHALIDNMPRMTMGATELTANAVAYQYRLETPPTLAGRLVDLVARVPSADPDSQRMLDLAFGMRFGAVRDFLREKAEAVAAQPYRCEQLEGLNAQAEKLLAQLSQPMPPFVNNFRGLRVSVDEIAVGRGGLPTGARGQLALHVEQPQMFLGMAQMFLPNLAELGLEPGGPPVRLPEDLFPIPGVVAFAAMTGEAIGLSVGAGEEAVLPAYLDQAPGPEGMFLSLSYDTAAYLDFTERMAGRVEAAYEEGEGADEYHGTADGPHAVSEAAREAFRAMADRSTTTLRFAPDGLLIDGRMTFKP